MTVLILIAGLTFGMFTYEPSWFAMKPHYYHMTYNNKYDCEGAREMVKNKSTV